MLILILTLYTLGLGRVEELVLYTYAYTHILTLAWVG